MQTRYQGQHNRPESYELNPMIAREQLLDPSPRPLTIKCLASELTFQLWS